jgi:hypothetical protein
MKTLPLLTFLAGTVLVASGCQAKVHKVNDHWESRSIGDRMARAFLSYDSERDGEYIDFQYEKKRHINLTLKRHFFNSNPENPFEVEDKEYYKPRPPHSLVPRPWNYIHLEGFALGAILYGAGGAFFPLPLDSVIGTLSPGGDKEFEQGMKETFERKHVQSASFMHSDIGFDVRSPAAGE